MARVSANIAAGSVDEEGPGVLPPRGLDVALDVDWEGNGAPLGAVSRSPPPAIASDSPGRSVRFDSGPGA
jgi:hypothetical protein